MPPNIKTNKRILGKTPDQMLFSKPTYTAIGDPFRMVANDVLKGGKNPHEKGGHDRAFKPYGNPKERAPKKAAVEWMQESKPLPDPKRFRDEDGNIIAAPPNMKTNPVRKGKAGRNVTFEKFPEHMQEDYNVASKIAKAELEYHYSKLQDKPFSQNARRFDHFFSNKQTYMEDPPVPPREEKKRVVSVCEHDRAFRPPFGGKTGVLANFEKFPEHKPDPPEEKKKKVVDPDAEAKVGFKMTYKMRSRPTPSIATNVRNLKMQYGSLMRSPR